MRVDSSYGNDAYLRMNPVSVWTNLLIPAKIIMGTDVSWRFRFARKTFADS